MERVFYEPALAGGRLACRYLTSLQEGLPARDGICLPLKHIRFKTKVPNTNTAGDDYHNKSMPSKQPVKYSIFKLDDVNTGSTVSSQVVQ